jgi:hypothetical protein
MTVEQLEEIFNKEDWVDGTGPQGDCVLKGLHIIAKYINPEKEDLIMGAGRDIIYSLGVGELLEKGLTEEDARELSRLNWCIEEDSLACYV